MIIMKIDTFKGIKSLCLAGCLIRRPKEHKLFTTLVRFY